MRIREAVGHAIRLRRQDNGWTLRELSKRSTVALGYLSELERGQKEASSEIVDSIAYALEIPTYVLVLEAGNLLEQGELTVPPSWQLELESIRQ